MKDISTRPWKKEINILVIDNNEADRLILKKAISNLPYKFSVVECFDALAGIKELNKGGYDCVFLDYLLPGADGITLLKIARNNHIKTPVVMMTSCSDQKTAVEVMKSGAVDCLVKSDINEYLIAQVLINVVRIRQAERKQLEAELKLKQEQEKYRQLVENVNDIIYRTNYEGCFIYINPAALRITEFTEAELLGKHFSELICQEDKDTAWQFYLKQFKNKTPDTYHEFRMNTKSGKVVYIGQNVSIISKNGWVDGFQAVARDITERKVVENSLRASEARFRAMADASPLGIFVADTKGDFLYTNKMFNKITGLCFEEALGKGWETSIHPEERVLVAKKWYGAVENQTEYANVYRYLLADGKAVWANVKASAIVDEDKVLGFVGAIEDITERIKTEKELIKAKEIAEDSVKTKEQFLANMSHEIRTPMHGIIGLTTLLLANNCSDEQKESLSAIKTSANNLLVIINEVLDLSKIEAGRMTFETIDFNLYENLKNIEQLLKPKADEKGIELIIDIEKDVPLFIKGDPTKLTQILINLLGNAMKFTEKGFVRVNIEVKNIKEGKVNLKFSIQDTGIGIPQDKIATVFESFTQAVADTTRKYGGTGLGLTIVKKLVELQSGSMSVVSEEGKGTTFYLMMDFGLSKYVPELKPVVNGSNLRLEKNISILVVEDNAISQMLIRKLIQKWGGQMEVAENGLIAVEMANKKRYDIILMDVQLPEMDGYKATSLIRESFDKKNKNIPILAMTAHASSAEYEKCKDAGMDDYISKPFEEEVLFNKVKKLIKANDRFIEEAVGESMNRSHSTHIETETINLQYLNNIFSGDTGIIKEILEVFIREMPEMVQDLNDSFQKFDWMSLKRAAHKIKSNMPITGIKILQEDIQEIEKLSQEKDKLFEENDHVEELEMLIKKFTRIINHVMEQFKLEIDLITNAKVKPEILDSGSFIPLKNIE